jgi:hypothetical protein
MVKYAIYTYDWDRRKIEITGPFKVLTALPSSLMPIFKNSEPVI